MGDAFDGAILRVAVTDGRFEVELHQPGMLRPLRGAELSDGTLRYLCLVAALLTVDPPPLLVLNEPETSLHPELLGPLARLVTAAGEQSQVMVVTHSEQLIRAMGVVAPGDEHSDERDEHGEDHGTGLGSPPRRVTLVKDLGETFVQGAGPVDDPGLELERSPLTLSRPSRNVRFPEGSGKLRTSTTHAAAVTLGRPHVHHPLPGRSPPVDPADSRPAQAGGGAHVTDIDVVQRPTAAEGGPDMIQLLTPEGQRVSHPDYDAYVADLKADDLRGFYRDLVLIRRLDAEGYALQRQGELGLWPSLLGQEAAQVGSGRALKPHDFCFPTYREHGVGFVRGMDPQSSLQLFRGVSQGGWDPKEHNFHLYTIVIGAQTLHATGYAMGVKMDGHVGTGDPDRDMAVICYFGDGATAQGDVNESFVYAASFDAPVVFFCQNNQWAISEPVSKQTRIPLYQRARGFGFPGIRVDGNDILATYAVTRHCLDEARNGNGPLLIEAFTYRMGAHTTADDPTKYRVSAEVEQWKLRDPILRLKTYLAHEGMAEESYFHSIDEEADQFAHELRDGCLSLQAPPGETMWEHVYAGDHPVMEAERAAYLEYQASFEGEH